MLLRFRTSLTAWLGAGEARVRRLWRSLGLNIPRRGPKRRRTGSAFACPAQYAPALCGAMTSSTTRWWMGAACFVWRSGGLACSRTTLISLQSMSLKQGASM